MKLSIVLILSLLLGTSAWAGRGAHLIIWEMMHHRQIGKLKVLKREAIKNPYILYSTARDPAFHFISKSGATIAFSRIYKMSNFRGNFESGMRITVFSNGKQASMNKNFHRTLIETLEDYGIDTKDPKMLLVERGTVKKEYGLVEDEYDLTSDCLDLLDLSFTERLVEALKLH